MRSLCLQEKLEEEVMGGLPGLLRAALSTHSAGNKPISSDSWTSLYKLPIEKRSVALQWRVVHGVMAMNKHVEHKDPRTGSHSLFCRTKETLQRLWLGCPRPAGLFSLL